MVRTRKLEDLQSKYNQRANSFSNLAHSATKAQKATLQSSIAIAELLAKKRKPFADGELIKEGAIKLIETLCSEETYKQKVLDKIHNVPMSRMTMSRRTEDIAEDIRQQQLNDLRSSPYYAIALDESSDIVDMAQLAVFVRYISPDWCVHQELLGLVPLSGRNTGLDIFNILCSLLDDCKAPRDRLLAITTDGANAMTGRKS